jgi:hypothetical protein
MELRIWGGNMPITELTTARNLWMRMEITPTTWRGHGTWTIKMKVPTWKHNHHIFQEHLSKNIWQDQNVGVIMSSLLDSCTPECPL